MSDYLYIDGALMGKMAMGGAARLRANADEVNKLNVFPVPDGDTGDNMLMTIESGVAALAKVNSDNISEVMNIFSKGMLLGARGNSGVILSQFFAGIAKGFDGLEKATVEEVGQAFESGVKQAYTAVMKPTEGTILTVAREGVEKAVKCINESSTVYTFFDDLVKEMEASLKRTPEILPVLKEANVVDSGGAGLLYIIDGLNRVLNGEEVPEEAFSVVSSKASVVDTSSFGPDSEMTYGYCTELLVQLQNRKTNIDRFDVEELKAFLMGIGDSIVAFKTDSIVKIHVHTFKPDKVLAHCRKFGEFLTVKIENMSVQHTSQVEEDEEIIMKKYGIVAVCSGPGIENLYKEMGTDQVVQGGQTQNPSTNDFLDAFSKVHAEHIFAFPNNGNILLAAQQAAELYDKAIVHVIPSKNVGSGYVAISSADFSNPDPEAIVSEMMEAMSNVTAGYVSPSIRDAEIGGVHIENGDTIGVIEKEIVLSKKDRLEAASALVDMLMADEEKFMLTVFTGKDATAEEQAELSARISESQPSAEVYFVEGGQDIYPYIFVAE
ncbi:MAG: DAK2 domain-containing protein [Ruminococcaceae bacterium]|nr:DAK2 domain-containing protein [Oscillospiraceae bacterium]